MGSYMDDEGNTVVVKKDDSIREAVDIGYFNVENKYTPQKGELKVTKTWAGETINDHNYANKTRPEKIRFTLQVSYEKKDNKDVWVDADKTLLSLSDTYALVKEVDTSNDNATKFNATYSDLPLYINPTFNDDPIKDLTNGKSVPIKYRVKEEVVNAEESLKGYTQAIEEKGLLHYDPTDEDTKNATTTNLAVTNTLKTGSVTITKVWDDQGAVALADYSKYYYNVRIIVQSDDVGYNTDTNPSTETITTPNTDTTSTPLTLNGLPLYTKKGDPAKYYASEVSVDGDKIVKKYGYESSYEVFYTHTKLDTDGKPIRKKDEQGNPVVDAQGNLVYETEELVYTYTAQIPALNSWGLPSIDSNGSLATQDLTLDRVLIPGDDEPKNSLTITNTLPVVELELHNYWNDQQNQDGKRPTSAEFTLRRYRNITDDNETTIKEIPVSSDIQGAEIFSDTTTVNQNAIGRDSSNKGYWLGTFTKTENNRTVTKKYPYCDEANVPYVYFIDDLSKVMYNSQTFADYNSTLKHQYSITGITTRPSGENVTYGKIKDTYTQPDTTKLVYKGCFDVTNTYTPLTKTINVETTWNGDLPTGYNFATYTRPDKVLLQLTNGFGAWNMSEPQRPASETGSEWTKYLEDKAKYDKIQLIKNQSREVNVSSAYFMKNNSYFSLTDGTDEKKPSTDTDNDREKAQPWKYSDGVTGNDGSALYTGLPVYVNITGTDVVNGSAEAVTYYVDEVGEYNNNNQPVMIKSDLDQNTEAKQKMGAYVIDENHKIVTNGELTSATTGESVYRTDLNDGKGTVLQKVEFSNTLIVRPLIVEKDWTTNQGDKSVNENTHFDITAKIEIKQGSAYASLHENVHTVMPTPDAEFTIPSSITDYSAKMSLPLYIKDGTFATYQATEILPSGKSEYPHKYNNDVTNHVYRTGDFTLNADPVPTLFGPCAECCA